MSVWREAWDELKQDMRPAPWSARTWGEMPRFWRAISIALMIGAAISLTYLLLPRILWLVLTAGLMWASAAATIYQVWRNEEERPR
jgi:hypothetical protein